MKLRTLTGQRWPAKCSDGCGAEIPAGADVKVVVDLESRPRKAWLPEHSPDAGTWNRRGGGNGGSSTSRAPAGPTSSPGNGAPASPSSISRGPSGAAPTTEEEDETPSPSPTGPAGRASLGGDRPFSSGWITLSGARAGGPEGRSMGSVHVELGDHPRAGEDLLSLTARLNAALEADLRAKVQLLVNIHRDLASSENPARPLGRANRA